MSTEIKGKELVYFGTDRDNIRIYITKPTFDCEWYWTFGYLGNQHCHYHLKSHMTPIKELYDELLDIYELNPTIKANLWQVCELSATIYSLKAAADIFYRGGSNYAENPDKEQLTSSTMYKRLVDDMIPLQCQTLWNLIGGNKEGKDNE